ncbi:MAG TPA: polyprenyl synthetase family protein [Candidatus Limnocylindrales bacterium]|nr:polyprenyl synthetase family protein [Candidatus Limnocylindrales bacterium]
MTLNQSSVLVRDEQALDKDAAFDLQAALDIVEELMRETVNSDVDVLRDASWHILGAGGKRIRPRLTLLSFAAAGGENIDSVAPLAAAVELVHTASVVHDDINDHGVVRRGRPSVNSIWGRTFALLTGDFLFTKVYELMAPHSNLNMVMSEATTALVEGETLQAAAVKNNQFSREVYARIIALKTAALFKAAATLGARAANASHTVETALADYGFNIGLAFQIVDDVLDITAPPEQLGKTSGIDIEQGRGFAVAYEGADVAPATGDPIASLRARVLKGNAVHEGYEQALHFVEAAVAGLSVLPESSAKQQMVELAYSVVERNA